MGDTEFTALDGDANMNLVVAGITNDTAIADNTGTPFILYISNSGAIVWHKQFVMYSQIFIDVKFKQGDASKLVLVDDQTSLTIIVMNANDGSLMNTFQDTLNSFANNKL